MNKTADKKPVAVLISDVHYSVHTLAIADKAMRMAINKANELGVTLVVAGDLHDTKANIRGECVNAMQKTFSLAETAVFILVGNHDKINERSSEHSLNFLSGYADIVNEPRKLSSIETMFGDPGILIPYHHDGKELAKYLETLPEGSRLIMHQGVLGSNAGHYMEDKSALSREHFKNFRVISGHYHERQDIKCGPPKKGAIGLFSYLGNPYTLGFGEANIEKGFNILYDDGILEFVPTNLRMHVIADISFDMLDKWTSETLANNINQEDLLWVKIRGTKEQLSTLNKTKVAEILKLKNSFRLDLKSEETTSDSETIELTNNQPVLLDSLIASLTNVSDEQKKRLKTIWRHLSE